MNNPRHLAVLTAICDTFIPSIEKADDPDGYWARCASETGVPERILQAVKKTKTEDQAQFKQLLDLLGSRLVGLTWMGPLKPVDKLSPAQRVAMFQSWANSSIPDLRNAYNVLRKLSGLIYYGDTETENSPNPNWKTIGYQPIEHPQRVDPAPLPILSANTSIDCDVLIIGSGAGGSVVAAQLAAAGLDVAVVEKGGYTPTHNFHQREFRSLQQHFESGSLLTSTDGGMTVLAGSTMGGGTTINWAATLRTPEEVLAEWAAFGNPHFLEKSYSAGFDFIEKRNSVNTDFKHNPQNQTLLRGAEALKYAAGTIPLNLQFPPDIPAETAWKSLGYSCYGDRFGIKQGAAQTFLKDAVEHGARLFKQVDIQRVIIKNGEVVGAEGIALDSETGAWKPLTVRAKKVVVATGALQAPVLLLKSGLNHPQIGRNLWLHPVSATAAIYQEAITPWQGPMMSAIVREFERLDGNWGVRIECPPIHPGLAAFALCWESGESFKELMAQIQHLAVQIVITRDKFGGRVTVGKKSGQPVIHYKLSDYDKKHLLRGIQECVRMQAAAGAERILAVHNQPIHYFPKTASWDSFQTAMSSRKWRPNDFGLFSAHQMGTCRMGGNPDSPVKPNGETREVRNLFVADGSLFPSASGVNPMLSIQTLAYYVAGCIKG